MQWVKTINYKRISILVLFISLFFLVRLPRLGNDAINPDGINWYYRSQQFVNGLKYLQFEKTYQHYHPGVTLMWITGPVIELTKQVLNTTLIDQYNFYIFHFLVKFSLVVTHAVLSLFVIFFLSKILSFKDSLIITSLFTFEPFFVGNSRLYHMDILFTLFLFLSLIISYYALSKKSLLLSSLGGIFLGFSFLTKSIGIGSTLFVLGYIFLQAILNKDSKNSIKENIRRNIKYILAIFLSFLLSVFIFFPALWVKPIYYISEIFSEGERIGIRKGHEQILFGESTNNAGLLFYPLVILMKVSPVVLLGVFLSLILWEKECICNVLNVFKKNNLKEWFLSFNGFLTIFYIGYFIVMLLPSKKIDRYMLVEYPYLAFLAFNGYSKLIKKLYKRDTKKKINKSIIYLLGIVLVLCFWIYPFYKLFPYYFVYTSPIFGSGKNANNIIAQKPFGIGMFDVKEMILDKYGEVNLGFMDTKPMEAIYPSSKVFDIRVSGSEDYDVVVLASDEKMSDKLSSKFEKKMVMYINDIEYWSIYEKIR